jgi:hypothetical protein
MNKFKLTDETKIVDSVKLYRIQALIDIPAHDVKAGDLGGWVESEKNLDQSGNAWVSGNAQVSGDARVSGDAWVSGDARVYGDAWVSGNACVSGDARVYGDAQVYGNAWVSGDAWVYGDAWVSGDARVAGDATLRQGKYHTPVSNTILPKFSMTPNYPHHIAIGCRIYDINQPYNLKKEMTENNIDIKYKKQYELAVEICREWLFTNIEHIV